MANTTFRGPLRVGFGATVGIVPAVRQIALPVTAIANTDLILPMPRCQILGFTQMTMVAYTAATITMSLGTTAGGAEIVSAADIKAQAYRNALTIVAGGVPSLASFLGGNLFIRLAQGTPTAVGNGILFVQYVPLDDVLPA